MPTKARTKAPPPTLLSIALVVAGLYFARDVLIPIALAVLLSFLLAPAVSRLQRAGMRRGIAVILVMALAFLALGSLGWYIGDQAVELAAKVPEYRDNIHNKIDSLHLPAGGSLSKASDTVKSLIQEIEHAHAATAPATQSATESEAATQPDGLVPPVTNVRVVETAPTGWAVLGTTVGHLVGPLENALIVAVLAIFILLELEDIHDRVLHLLGGEQLTVTAQAMEDAAQRVGHYLLMQTIINGSVGLIIGAGLALLGVPNALVWGFLAMVLRFIPYIGIWLAAAAPIALSIAVFPGWLHAGLAAGLFLVVELSVSNFLEPLIYGAGTGVSTVAILIAAIFWAWLWGGVGLLLATPLTVCLVVMGQYVPRLRFLSVALSDKPAMSPAARLYHRLLAMDASAARELADDYRTEKSETDLFDDVLIPALIMAEHDRHRGDLLPDREKFIYDNLAALAKGPERRGENRGAAPSNPSPPDTSTGFTVLCVPAKDRADEIAAAMLCRLLNEQDVSAASLSAEQLASELVAKIERDKPRAVAISAVPPGAMAQAAYLCKRLRSRVPDVKVQVGLWKVRRTAKDHAEHFHAEFDARTASTLREAVEQLQAIVRRPSLAPAAAGAFVNEFVQELLAMNGPLANTLLDRAVGEYSPEDITIEVLQPAMIRIEEARAAGTVSIEQESFAANIIRNRLLAMSNMAMTTPLTDRRAIAACAPDEQHDVWVLVLGLLMKIRGWDVVFSTAGKFGANAELPIDAGALSSPGRQLNDAIDAIKPQVVLFSATALEAAKWLSGIAAEIATPDGKPPVLVAGGAAFTSELALAGRFSIVVRGDGRAVIEKIEAMLAQE